jgi:hypothetical protein
MQEDRSGGQTCSSLIDVETAMSAGEKNTNGPHDNRQVIAKDAIEPTAEPQEHAADVPPADAETAPRPRPVWSFRNRHVEDVPITAKLPRRATDAPGPQRRALSLAGALA